MCEYCYKKDDDEIMGKTIRQFEWKETAGYEPPKNRNDFLEMFILKLKNDKKAGLMIDNGYGYRYIDINYCMFCRKEAGRVKHITLKEMLNTMVDSIINKKEYPTFYYKRQNYYTGNDEFIEITEIDLMCGRFKTVDDDFSEFSWELEKSNIYMKEDK